MASKAVVPVLIAGASVLLAADFWQTKQPSDWTEKEAQRLLTKSPWAREMNLSGSTPGGGGGFGGPDASSGGGGWGSGGQGGGGRGGQGGGMGDMGGGGGGGSRRRGGGGGGGFEGMMPSLYVVVRFESAAPVRAASSRSEAKIQEAIAEWTKEYYVVTMSGFPMGKDGGQERMARMAETIKAATTLTVKGKDPVRPARIGGLPGASGPIWAFLFPRSNAIAVEDKEVVFQSKVMRFDVKAKFALKDMMYQGKLEL